VGPSNYIWLLARDRLISVVTFRSLRGNTSTVHTIAASQHESLLVIDWVL
jgi:hypothetical protein